MIALTSGDAAIDLRDLADDVERNGWETYTKAHVAEILRSAAECLELGERIVEVCVEKPTERHLSLVKPADD